MSDAQKETIIIVHGTWAAPEPGKCQWYEPPNELPNVTPFVAKLDAALAQRGSAARCWAHRSGKSEKEIAFISWSGQNAWIDRAQAATRLASSIDRLQADGWRVHIVAHSHGGNVALEALPQMKGGSGSVADFSGTLTTLGTPFIDAMSPIAKRLNFRRRIDEIVAWTFYVLICLLGIIVVLQAGVWPWGALLAGVFFIGLFSLMRARRPGGWSAYWGDSRASGAARPFVLALGSSMDEAWQLLHHLRNMNSPIAPRFGLWRYLFSRHREYLQKSRDIERVHGAALFNLQPLSTKISAVLFQILLALTVWVFVILYPIIMSDHSPDDFMNYLKEKNISDPTLEEVSKENDRLYSIGKSSNNLDAWGEHWRGFRNAVDEKIKQLPPDQLATWNDEVRARNSPVFAALVGGGAFAWFGLVTIVTFFVGRSFYSVVWAPFRWIGRRARALAGVPSYIGSYIVRRNAWTLLQELAMGLEGYRFALPVIAKAPAFVPVNRCRYEDLPKEAEQRALSMRNAWISRHFGDVADTFSKMVVTASDLSSLLRLVEGDQSLVHAAYYTDDECIQRIADWIAGTDGLRQPSTPQTASADATSEQTATATLSATAEQVH
jgi:hypothetical protein